LLARYLRQRAAAPGDEDEEDEGDEGEHEEAGDEVGGARGVGGAPAVAVEFAAGAPAELALDATEEAGGDGAGGRGEGAVEQGAHVGLVEGAAGRFVLLALGRLFEGGAGLVVELGRLVFGLAHLPLLIFSPMAASTSARSWARPRWIRLFTVPSARPVM